MTEQSCDERVDVYVPHRLRERIEDRLEYGDSLSEWMREAAKQRLEQSTE